MGKGNAERQRSPQRSKLESNREAKRVIVDSIFGPHRPVTPESSQTIRDKLVEMQRDGHIPEHVKIRDYFRLTLFEKLKMRRSLERGIIGGYEMRRAIEDIKQQTIEHGDEVLPVKIGKACLMNRRDRAIVMRLEDHPVIEAEHKVIVDTLGRMGLRGLDEGRPFKPHLQLAEARNNLSITEKHHVTHVLEDLFMGETIELVPLLPGEPRRR